MAESSTIWGIHAGRTGDADTMFLRNNVIAIGWPEVGDLGKLGANRDAFKTAIRAAYPDKKPGAIPNNAGQLIRFVHEMVPGDLVVYPSKRDRKIHIGRITGKYTYRKDLEPEYPNVRAVEWLKEVPRSTFSQGALYEIGSAMSLFLVKNYADEFVAVLEGRPLPPTRPNEDDEEDAAEDPTVGVVAEQIEELTRDFVLKRLARELKGHPFADFVGELLKAMGFRCRVSPPGPDSGIDIVAHKDELGLEPPIIKVQVKATEGSVGDPVVSALFGKLAEGEFGLAVTLGTFTPQAKRFAEAKSNLRLIDGEELVRLVLSHYEDFDSRYKGVLPLKRVYVPEPLDESEGD